MDAILSDYGVIPFPGGASADPGEILWDGLTARELDGAPVGTIGGRTAADLSSGPPPDQLVPPFIDPDGPVILFGKGGACKGITSCWLIAQLIRADHQVMIVDYEGHEREWGSRLRGLGLADEELRRVHYRAPFGTDWTAPTGSLSEVALAVRADCDRLGITYVVVDSFSPATSNGDTMGGEAAAREYFGALVKIGRPSLTIAHVRGDAEKFPDRPFGSVFIHNYARETWAIYAEADADNDPDDPSRPARVHVELRNQKKSGGPKARPQLLAVEFYGDGSLVVTKERTAEQPLDDAIAGVLQSGPMTVKAIVAAIKEDGRDVGPDTVSTTLKRHADRFAVEGDKRPRRWALRT